MNSSIHRNHFVLHSTVGSTIPAIGASLPAQAASPNEQVVIGVVGLSRGRSLTKTFGSSPFCRIKYLCDVEQQRLDRVVAEVEKAFGYKATGVTDFRHILDDSEVDAVVLALPVHWHAPMSILACRAGKDVYVEKPCTHNPREGEWLVEAARKYKRVVQMGNQRRSSPVIREAIARLHDGEIGKIYHVRCWYANLRESIGKGVEAPVPESLDYDLWQGPAQRRPYKDNLIPYNWHWHWHWGTGELGGNGSHTLDIARWGLQAQFPTAVNATGGRYRFDDDQETPDTLLASYDFPEGITVFWEGLSCNRPGIDGGLGVTFHGENGSMTIGSKDYTLRDRDGQVLEQQSGSLGDGEHRDNFLEAVRQNNPDILNAEIEGGHRSTLLCHLGNIAYRTRSRIRCGDRGTVLDNEAAAALWQRDYEPGWEPVV